MFKWLDNFWYHYKWPTIIVTFFAIVAIICFSQLATKEEYDAFCVYLGDGSGSITATDRNEILSKLRSLTDDNDENGTVNVCFSREAYTSDTTSYAAGTLNTNVTSFMSSMLYQDYYIFFISQELYDYYKSSEVFVKLDDYVSGVTDDMRYDDKALILKHTALGNSAGFSRLPDDTLIVLKTIPYHSSSKITEKQRTAQSQHADIIQRIIDLGNNSHS